MKTSTLWHAPFWAALALAFGCASAPRPTAVPAVAAAAVEEFDPQTLDDDNFLIRPVEGGAAVVAPPGRTAPPPAAAGTTAEGYRVQIAAVLNRARAEALRAEAGAQLKAPVYIQHDDETGLYKIQAGNGRTARDVESLRQEARRLGYREAFVVRTWIEVAAAPPRRPAATRGYRVQVFSASSQQAAEQARDRARELLDRDDIYIEFEPPYFKVRIGNFRTQQAAEGFIEVARERGYDTPFPVQTQILVSPE